MAGRRLCEAGEALWKVAEGLSLCSLHHASARLVLAGGVHARAESERKGRASTAFTMDAYGHCLPTAQEHVALEIGERLSKRGAR